jgi:DNA repair exonuclease SbcCD ATPase subunit
MKTPKLYQQVILGLLIGMFIVPANVVAQFGGPVTVVADTSPTTVAVAANTGKSFVEDLKRNIQEAKEWIEQQEQRAREIEHWIQEMASLGGILDRAEEMIANKDSMIRSMSNLGQTIRGIIQLKDQIESFVRRRIIALKNIDDRLRSGIFNMDANLADLEEYIRNGLGRGSESKLNNLERLAQMDVELQRWYEELQRCLYKKMIAQKQVVADRKTLDDEIAKPEKERSVPTINAAKDELSMLDTHIEQLDTRISELTSLIEERCKRYKMKMKDMSDFARQIEANQQAWKDFLNVNQEALKELEAYQKTPSKQPRGLQ